MGIILKHIIRNTLQKKARTLLVVLSTAISVMLMFSSLAMPDCIIQVFKDQAQTSFGNADIVIQPKMNSKNYLFQLDKADKNKFNLEYAYGAFLDTAQFKDKDGVSVSLSVTGMSLDELQKMNPFTFKENNGTEFKGNNIVISDVMSKKYNLKINDKLKLDFGYASAEFSVYAIANNNGPFYDNLQNFTAVVPYDTLIKTRSFDNGDLNAAFLKVNEGVDVDKTIEDLKKVYSDYSVTASYNKEEIENQVMPISSALMFMSLLVILLTVFIIHTVFKVISAERMPVIGSFRSIGASKKNVNIILLLESMFYGLIGGVLGCVAGVWLLGALSKGITSAYSIPNKSAIVYNWGQLVVSFIITLLVCVIAAARPVMKASSLSLREIMLDKANMHTKKLGIVRLIIGCILLTASIVMKFAPARPEYIGVGFLSVVLSFVSLIVLIPYIIKLLVIIVINPLNKLAGNNSYIATKDLGSNKSIRNNVLLLAVSVSALIAINIISYSVVDAVTGVFKNSVSFDIACFNPKNADAEFEKLVASVNGVESTCGEYTVSNVEVKNKAIRISIVHGIDTLKYTDYFNVKFLDDKDSLYKQIKSGSNIILSTNLGDMLGVSKNDSIELNVNDQWKEYKVIGFFNTLLNRGNYALMDQEIFKQDFNIGTYSEIDIKTKGDPEIVLKELKDKFGEKLGNAETVNKLGEREQQSNDAILAILKFFSVCAMLVAFFGIFNNLVIIFIQRKKLLQLYGQ